MRYVNSRCLFVALMVMGVVCAVPVKRVAATSAGLTVTPATATLSLAKNEPEVRRTLAITNHYAAPITLHFSFATPQIATDRDRQALRAISVATTDATVGAGASLTQTVILTATSALAPGSAQVELVVSQAAIIGSTVGVLPELRLPLILVREDGATSNLDLAIIQGPNLALTVPKTLAITLKNSGNMIAIPRGFATITAPGGRLVGKGTLNIASVALSPGDHHAFNVPVTRLSSAALPGPYTIKFGYGLGGDHPAKTAATRFVYIAWWHIALLIAVLIAIYYLVRGRLSVHPRQYRRYSRAPPKKTVFKQRKTA